MPASKLCSNDFAIDEIALPARHNERCHSARPKLGQCAHFYFARTRSLLTSNIKQTTARGEKSCDRKALYGR